MNFMKSEKGITLTVLVAYITVFMIILTMMTTISSYFYNNIYTIKDSHKYISEYNKFSMFFVVDVKKNESITSITSNRLEFGDGTVYSYRDNSIYRNDIRISKYVKSFTFTQSNYTVNEFTKKIINVNTSLGNNNEQITRNIDFVLKYW